VRNEYKPLITLSAWAFVLKLIALFSAGTVAALFGAPFQNARGFFQSYAIHPFINLLRDDFLNLTMISLYLLSFPGLFILCREGNYTAALLGLGGTVIAVILSIGSHKGLALAHLYDSYAAAGDPSLKNAYLAAADALVSNNLWHSTSGFFSGLFLQGGGVLMGLAMWGIPGFRKVTVFSILAANGLDLINHLIHYTQPAAAQVFLYLAGPFYILWFIFSAFDLFRAVKPGEER